MVNACLAGNIILDLGGQPGCLRSHLDSFWSDNDNALRTCSSVTMLVYSRIISCFYLHGCLGKNNT